MKLKPFIENNLNFLGIKIMCRAEKLLIGP